MSSHATALANRDGEVLERSSQAFEDLGWQLLAAEAAAEAMTVFDGEGRRERARTNAARARELVDRCEGPRTPALLVLEGTTGLSAREREVAVLAADGHSSREIASRLHLSVRTVDNHLQRCYHKLGVTRREALAEVLRPPTERLDP